MPAPEMPAAMLYAAGSIELIGGALIMIGLMTSWAAFVASGLYDGRLLDGSRHECASCRSRTKANWLWCTVLPFCSFLHTGQGCGVWTPGVAVRNQTVGFLVRLGKLVCPKRDKHKMSYVGWG